MVDLIAVCVTGTLSFTAPGSAPAAKAHVPVRPIELLTSPTRRVRTANALVEQLLADGVRRSATFAGLVSALSLTDVIVYIEPVDRLPATLAGRLMLVPVRNDQRYLRIQVRDSLSRDDLIALIGHELQHALEVAEAPHVRDGRSLLAHYQRIGHPGTALHAFDTTAAQDAGRKVRIELAS